AVSARARLIICRVLNQWAISTVPSARVMNGNATTVKPTAPAPACLPYRGMAQRPGPFEGGQRVPLVDRQGAWADRAGTGVVMLPVCVSIRRVARRKNTDGQKVSACAGWPTWLYSSVQPISAPSGRRPDLPLTQMER